MCYYTRCSTIIAVDPRSEFRTAITAHYCNQGIHLNSFSSKYRGNTAHNFITPNRTIESFEGLCLYKCLGKIPASCKAASTAVGCRKSFFHLVNSRIFIDFEPLCNEEENDSRNSPDGHQCDNCVYYNLTHTSKFVFSSLNVKVFPILSLIR